MKALSLGLARVAPVQVASTQAGMYTDSEAPAIQNARDLLFERLEAASPGSVVPLILDGVELSASCIASILGPAIRAIVEGYVPGRFLIGVDPGGRNTWDADAGLKKESDRVSRKLSCVWETSRERCDLVGPVDEQVMSSYAFVRTRWREANISTTARDLASHTGISIQAASNRLSKAAAAGLLYVVDRETVPGGGAQNLFVPVD